MRKIIVIGASHHNTLSVVRCIGEVFGQIELVLVGCKKSYVSKSKYVSNATFLSDNNALYLWAKENKSTTIPIVVSCADGVSQVFDAHYEELRHYYVFFNAGKDGRLTYYMNKQNQVELAKKVGFLTPVSVCYTNTDHVSDFERYPCIVKPLQSYVGGKKIWHCNDAKELQNVIKAAPEGVLLQVQELVKNEHEIVLPGLITKDGIYIPGYILKHRDFLGGTTYSSVKRHNTDTEKIVSYTETMLRKIGYEGLFGIEAMFNGKEYVFIELNLRNDATCYSMAVAGANLPAMYIDAIVGNKVELNDVSEITSIVEDRDFTHVLRRKVGICQWFKDIRTAQCKFIYNKHDKKPLYACVLNKLLNKIRK